MTNVNTKYHRLFKFEYNPLVDSPSMPAWVVKLVADGSILFSIADQKWFFNKEHVIEDGDYLVQIHPDYSELQERITLGKGPHESTTFEFMSKVMSIDTRFIDAHSYGVLLASRYAECVENLQKVEPLVADELARLRKEQG